MNIFSLFLYDHDVSLYLADHNFKAYEHAALLRGKWKSCQSLLFISKNSFSIIRESVDPLRRDGADTPIKPKQI